LYRNQIASDFNYLSGDKYDAVIVATILEYWRDFFSGDAAWADVRYFYPYANTLAQTDGYFIIGMIYTPLRHLGMDPFVAAEVSAMILKGAGFFGMYWMCRAVLGLKFQWAVFAALIFTLSNGMTSHNSRIQLATVAFAPFIFTMLWKAFCAFKESSAHRAGYAWALGAAILYGAWCLTCFYMAWFFAYFMIALALVLVFSNWSRIKDVATAVIRTHWAPLLTITAVGALALTPFVALYLPKSAETGVRTISDAIAGAPSILGVAEVGGGNWMFGELYSKIADRLNGDYARVGEYYNTGFNLALLFLFAFAFVNIKKRSRACRGEHILWAASLATVLSWLLTLKLGPISGWNFVYHLVPGAKALRVVSAYQIFLAVSVVAMVAKYLNDLDLPRPIALFLVVFLAFAEFNTPYINLNRSEEMARVTVGKAPAECRSFYVSPWQEQAGTTNEVESLYAHNVSAMLIAQLVDLPTVNGFASYNPKDWDFADPAGESYDDRVRSFAQQHGVMNGLCKLDLNDKTWDVSPPASLQH